jgi:hypothetical protein
MNTLRSLSRFLFQGLHYHLLGMILMSLPLVSQGQEPSMVGQYVGVVARTGEIPIWTNSQLGARLELTAQASGNFSGKLIYSGTTLSFTGTIDRADPGSGTSSVRIPRGSLPALTLDLTFGEDLVTGSLSHPDGEMVSVSGWRKVWNNTSRPATAFLGRHHFHLQTELGEVGTGFGSFIVPADGDITVNGKLPDGSAFKTIGFLGPNGQVLVYEILHSKPGSLLGVLMISGSTDEIPSTFASSDFGMSWYKPTQTAKSERFFREGFTTNCQASGGLYKVPAAGDVAAGLPDVTANGYLYFSGIAENSETPAGAFFTLNSAGKVTMSNSDFNRAKATLTVKPATGEYSGGFTLVDYDYNNQIGTDKQGNPVYRKLTRKVKYCGLIVDDGTTAVSSGFYVTGSNPDSSAEPPTTLLTSPLIGGVASLQRNPEAPTALEIGFEQGDYTVTEGEVTFVRLGSLYELTENRTFRVNVLPGTASSADLTATSLTVTIPAGSLTAEIELPVKDDGLDENDETFRLSIADGAGFDLNENSVVEVTVTDDDFAVEIIGDPQSQLVGLNSNVEMRVGAEGSDMKYQWLRQNANISGATSNPLFLSNVQLNQAGTYKVKVGNEINEQDSLEAELAVVDLGSKLMAILPDSTATLNAGVAGTAGTLTYQWQVGGIDVENDPSPAQRITGADTPTLVIKNVSSEDIGDYVCVVSQPASFSTLSSGNFYLRLPSLPPSLPDLELPGGQVLRPYYSEILFDTDFEAAPGSFSATGLPNGLRIDPNTGIISGKPTTPVSNARVVVSATNPRGTTSTEGLLTIRAFPASALGTFQGLVARSFVQTEFGPASTWPQSNLGARFELTTTVTGSFSGKIIGTTTQNFSGALTFEEDEILIGSASVPQANKKLPPLSFNFRIYLPDQTLTGSLAPLASSNLFEPAQATSVWGWRNLWTKTQPATDYVGRYNFILNDAAGASPLESPSGTGFGSFVVPGSGTFNVTGNLPDGTAFICNTFLGPKGEVLLFQPIYKNPGSLHGAVQVLKSYADSEETPLSPFEKGPPSIVRLSLLSDVGQELDCTWFKPYQTDAKDKTYRAGFSVRSLVVDGGLYTPPEPGQIVMDLPEVQTNAQIQFAADDSGLDVMPTGFTIPSTGKPVIPTGSANPYKLTFTLNAETGHFNGAFTRRDEDPSRPPLYSETTGNLIRPQGYFTRNARFFGIITTNPTSATVMGTGYYTIPQLPRPNDVPPVTEANAPNVTASFTLTRNDNAEEPLTLGFTQGDVITINEGEPAIQVAVSINAPASSRRTVPISLQHLNSSGVDVTLSAASVVFEPNESEAYVTLAVTQDNLDEQNEYLYLRLADGAGYNLSIRRLPITIVDDDESVEIQGITPPTVIITGNGASLAVIATGSEPLSYQWRLNGVAIPGALSAEYYIYPGSLSDSGRYDVVVSNRVNSQTSPVTDIAMLDSREFFFPVAAGSTANLTLNITAPTGSVTYEWSRTPGGIPLSDDTRISGSNSRTLTLRNVTSDDVGDYYCRVRSVNSTEELPIELISPVQRLVIATDAPLLTDIPDQVGSVARYFEYQVEFMTDSYRYPASFSATNLPSGLSIHPVTGLISGSPRATASEVTFTVTATNAAGSSSITGKITVDGLPDGIVGTFHGLVGRNIGMEDPSMPGEYTPPWPEAELGGLFELTTLSSGSFSGKLTYAGTAHNFTGFLVNDAGGQVTATTLIQRTGKPVLFIDVTLDPFADAVVGTIRNMAPGLGAEVSVSAWRKVWSVANPATAFAGTYNFSIASVEGGNERAPGGYGYASCTVPSNGAAFDIKGRLPDGKPFVCSSLLGPRGQFIIYQALYARAGSVLSQLSLNAPPNAESDGPSFVEVSGESSLYKPRQTASSETIYTGGIGPIGLNYEGGRYLSPGAGEVVMGVEDVIDNASIYCFAAGAEYSETTPTTVFRIRAAGTTVMKTGADNLAKINVTEIKPAIGEFKGSFTLSDTNPSSPTTKINRSSDFFGLFVQLPSGETVGRGYFTLKQMPDSSAIPPTTSATAPSYTGMVEVTPGPGPGL